VAEWLCPCNGCKKAAKQERERISAAIEEIDINTPSQLNALGLKMLIMDIINPPKSEAKK
jgi:hypothetical protein